MTGHREPGRIGFLWYSVTHWPYRDFYRPGFLAPQATAPAQRERTAMSIKGFLSGTKADDAEPKCPSRLYELLFPRRAAERWAVLEQQEELIIAFDADREEEDRAYERFADDCHKGIQKGNPPDSRALDKEIDRFSEQYPEISGPAHELVIKEAEPQDECDGSPDRTGRDAGEPPNPYDQWPYLATYWPQREAGA